MTFPDKSSASEHSISRFFVRKDKKKRKGEETQEHGMPDSNVSGRSQQNPVVLMDDSDEDAVTDTSQTNKAVLDTNNIEEESVITMEHLATASHKIQQDEQGRTISSDATSPNLISSSESDNPFANFAFQKSDPTVKSGSTASNGGGSRSVPSKTNTTMMMTTTTTAKCRHVVQQQPFVRDKKKRTEWVKICDLERREQDRIVKKWQSLADSTATLEDQRFQVLVAARLHARCQEPTVRRAMKSLRERYPQFSVDVIAKADPSEIAESIQCLQFYNAKAKQIVMAAKQIRNQFSGLVPEDEHSLLQITGIGKIFADLLAFVNKRSAYTNSD